MRRTNTNLKRIAFVKKLIVFVTIQIALIIVFAQTIVNSTPIDTKHLKSAIIVVDSVEYEYEFINGRMFRLFANSKEYTFPKFPVYNEADYSMLELYQSVHIGDEVTVVYIETEEYNLVVGANMGNNVLRSVDTYSEYLEKQYKIGWTTFLIVEVVFVCILIVFVLFHVKELKFFRCPKNSLK